MSEKSAPFKTLGSHLKYLREHLNETLAEVCGAVEIDETTLFEIEEGISRPEEEILLLLISHFSMSPQEAIQVWDLAGYDGEPDLSRSELPSLSDRGVVMVVATDPRTIYSDGLDINCNQAGVTLHFTQAGKDKSVVVSKIGMSYEQAEKVYESLQAALLRAKYMKGPKGISSQSQENS